MHQNKLFGLCR